MLTDLFSILKKWDIRFPSAGNSDSDPSGYHGISRSSSFDPTSLTSRRARAISSLTSGSGAAHGYLFGVGADSHIHVYDAASLAPLPHLAMSDPRMKTSSFYIRASVSPCGRWVACGSGRGGAGGGFVFDFGAKLGGYRSRWRAPTEGEGVQLFAQDGEIGAVDWAAEGGGTLATCADDGTVRVWRADHERNVLGAIDEDEGARDYWAYAEDPLLI
jgi:denticleless